jgi:hypothetical protein
MIKLEVVGGQVVLEDIERYGAALREGAIEGIRNGAKLVADEVRRNTPEKTGKAKSSVVVREASGGKAQTVTFDYKKSAAFYMRFFITGVKAHQIAPRRLTERGRRIAFKRKYKKLVRGGMADLDASLQATQYVEDRTKKRSLHFIAGGGEKVFSAKVLHPGFKATAVFKDALNAKSAEVQRAIALGIEDATRRAERVSRFLTPADIRNPGRSVSLLDGWKQRRSA